MYHEKLARHNDPDQAPARTYAVALRLAIHWHADLGLTSQAIAVLPLCGS